MVFIHPDLFKCKRTIDASHIRSAQSNEVLNASDKDILHLVHDTIDKKKDCAEWARANISTDMLQFATQAELKIDGRNVCNSSEIRRSWKMDPSFENQAKMFHVLFGGFDQQQGWQRVKEQEYMQSRNYKYMDIPWEGKGCVERMMTSQKNILVERINRSSRNTHCLTLTITRPIDERKTNPHGRRIKATFTSDNVVSF